jgi:Vacuolar sorting 38 and autophagy-related subunit 14
LVHYSDGSVRCLPHVHQLLLRERDKISLKTSSQLHHHEVEDFSRFEDDVFKTLDHVTPQQRRERTASSLLDQELEADELHRQKEDNKQGTMKDAESTQQQDPVGWLEQEMKQKLQLRETIQASAYPYTEKEAEELDLKAQNGALQLQIEEEERLLEEEMRYFREEQAYLASLVQELQELESETALIEAELQSQSVGLQQDELLKQAQSIKLVRDLQVVYPITLDSAASSASSMTLALIGGAATNRATAGGYLIRGLRLPVDIYTTTVPEEEINASLGYCAHLVFMIAKYLTIQLRHRIFCNSSRSAIQQDGVGVFPLFLGRMVARSLEREQVDRGARLLGANVNCILMHLNMPDSLQQVHILARLQAILSFVATGDLPGNMMQPAGSSGTVAVAGQ